MAHHVQLNAPRPLPQSGAQGLGLLDVVLPDDGRPGLDYLSHLGDGAPFGRHDQRHVLRQRLANAQVVLTRSFHVCAWTS